MKKDAQGLPIYGRPIYATNWLDQIIKWFRTPSPSMIQWKRNAPYSSRTYGR